MLVTTTLLFYLRVMTFCTLHKYFTLFQVFTKSSRAKSMQQ